MPDDDRRPRITRTNSLFLAVTGGPTRPQPFVGPVQRDPLGRAGRPNSNPFAGVTARGTVNRGTGPVPASVGQASGEVFIRNPAAGSASRNVMDLVPDGYEFVRAAPGGIVVRPERPVSSNGGENRGSGAGRGTGSFYERVLNETAVRARISAPGQTVNGVLVGTIGEANEAETEQIGANAQTSSVFGPLNLSDIDPNGQFLFDRAAPINPATGERTGLAQSRGVFGSADSLERQLTPGVTTTSGTNENIMTISAGVLWLRNLAARDKAAYNKLVVLLRNAGYGTLSSNDAELPLNGYSQQVGVAFALAANDLAQANSGGDGRTLMEYLTERGQGYADFLAQEEADAAAADAYVPVERQFQDPATLRASAKAAAIEALGRKLTDEEEARFEAAFRARENAFYDQLDSARENETRFAAFAPDVSGQVNEFIDGDEFETERAANSIGEFSQVFMRMMGVGG